MSKKKSAQHKKKPVKHSSKQRSSSLTPWQIAVVLGVVLLVAGVLWFKNRPATTESVAAGPPALVTPTGEGVAEVQTALDVRLPGEDTAATTASAVETGLHPRAGESPEAHLDRLLEEGRPVFAFFHSYTCYQCTEMDKLVQQIHPAFAEQVALVDVDVYDTANRSLLRRAGIQVIPTLIFIERTGEGRGYTGMMPADQLQEMLAALAAGGTP